MTTEERVRDLEREVAQAQASLGTVAENFNAGKLKFMDGIQVEFTTHKIALEQVVVSAREEFQKMDAAMRDLNGRLAIAMTEIERRLKDLEKSGEGRTGSNRGYLPQKSMIPDIFSDKAEDWRMWQEDVADYLDSVNPGVKELLTDVGKEKDPVDEDWRQDRSGVYEGRVLNDQ
eukprot:1336212-Lingulodinium_polyedra.AAC.1